MKNTVFNEFVNEQVIFNKTMVDRNNKIVDITSKVNLDVETIKNETIESLRKDFDIMKGEYKELSNNVKNILDDNKNIKEDNEKLKIVVDEMSKETNKVTKTLLTHGSEKRKLENSIHNLIYRELKKDSLRDELFHGFLSKSCKYHINKSLGVSAFQWIEIDDISIVETLIMKFLNKTNIHSLMRKETSRLKVVSENSKKENKKKISEGNARKFELLEKLLEDVGGDTYAI
ncbi:hypothetical protein [uncultured Clostridium sp.]|uniref:hypothetical protein n=1 Tax=uncultured Clostridium sp. TaxID=59620 RepID=UPI00321766FF